MKEFVRNEIEPLGILFPGQGATFDVKNEESREPSARAK